MVRKELIGVYNNTKEVVENIGSKSKSYLFSGKFLPLIPELYSKKFDPSTITVKPTDTITTALKLDGEGRTCILNMASNKRPGGGVESGAVAQEECLFRCTDLFKTVDDIYYPLGFDEAVYTTDVMIVKDKDYNLIETPVYVDCITMAAINLNKYQLSRPSYEGITRDKINMMLNLAEAHKCENLVLGAWGCGVYKNDPNYISNVFMSVIRKGGYNFKKIVFGVINDDNSVDNNYEIFKRNLTDG